ncbi:hypothetical protein [Microcoleus sp. Pol7_B2]|uniref:hypothetical protein n=1 Tax=Microcoleus sp. Pol7_B2 TaxID=2818895 RepID=UPI002FD60F28
MGDREFCSVGLANWLKTKGISFCLKLKKKSLSGNGKFNRAMFRLIRSSTGNFVIFLHKRG